MKTYFNGSKIRFVDRADPVRLYEFTGFHDGVFSLSHTTNWMAQSGPQGPQLRQLAGPRSAFRQMVRAGLMLLSPDNHWLADFRGTGLDVCPRNRPTPVVAPAGTRGTICPTFSHNSRLLAVGGTASAQVWLIDPATGEELAMFYLRKAISRSITWLSAGRRHVGRRARPSYPALGPAGITVANSPGSVSIGVTVLPIARFFLVEERTFFVISGEKLGLLNRWHAKFLE